MKFWKDILTEDDHNSVYCPVRVIAVSGAGGLLLGALYVAIVHGTFDAVAYGTAVAAIATAAGVGAGVKKKLGA
jgi:hypothetical protein